MNTSTGAISGTPTAASAQTAYTITASNSAGSTSATIQLSVIIPLAPPSGLSYSPSTISATVGQTIAPVTPTVTGTVTSYSVSPALPAGLSLNSTSGALSGVPTAVTALATYTVTATNSSGSTSTNLQITVNAPVPAPTNLSYARSPITATVGKAFTPDLPLVTGVVSSYTVSPALPAGMTLDSTNGVIAGTPTSITASANYTITATNSGGSTTATVAIVVNKAYTTLLDLGHGTYIDLMRATTTRLFSRDADGHWVLWDYAAGTQLVSGDQFPRGGGVTWDVDLAGNTLMVGIPGGVQVFSANGNLLSNIAIPKMNIPGSNWVPSWLKLASDGSYIAAGSTDGFTVWSPAGKLLISRSGDYHLAKAFATPQQVMVAQGPAGQNVIETISVATGNSSVGPAFSGYFYSWFQDGNRFFTNTGSTVWVYSSASVQEAIMTSPIAPVLLDPDPPLLNFVGQGNWMTFSGGSSTYVYAVGANSPTVTYSSASTQSYLIPSGSMLAVGGVGAPSFVVDLSGSSPVKTNLSTNPQAFAAATTSQLFLAGSSLVVDESHQHTLNHGALKAIAGSPARIALSTYDGQITYFLAGNTQPDGSFAHAASKLQLSDDGTVLGIGYGNNIDFISLPSQSLINTFTYPPGSYTDFTMARTGTLFGKRLATTWQVIPVGGGSPLFSINGASQPISFSPDATLAAISPFGSGDNMSGSYTVNVYKNGQIQTAVNGLLSGWLDNTKFLVNTFNQFPTFMTYATAVIYDAGGNQISTSPIPQLFPIQSASGNQVYSPSNNIIYSLSSGSPTWTGPAPVDKNGSIAGPYVVFRAGTQVVQDTY
ncbi:MAG: putative Ig domain-containing protein [Acidobacteria bacterium]|nr:putative Ig domain-containing protein [Acidobacteriota bacterium]